MTVTTASLSAITTPPGTEPGGVVVSLMLRSQLFDPLDVVDAGEQPEPRDERGWSCGVTHESLHYVAREDLPVPRVVVDQVELLVELEAEHGLSPHALTGPLVD